jgi:hypothetical protein
MKTLTDTGEMGSPSCNPLSQGIGSNRKPLTFNLKKAPKNKPKRVFTKIDGKPKCSIPVPSILGGYGYMLSLDQ